MSLLLVALTGLLEGQAVSHRPAVTLRIQACWPGPITALAIVRSPLGLRSWWQAEGPPGRVNNVVHSLAALPSHLDSQVAECHLAVQAAVLLLRADDATVKFP